MDWKMNKLRERTPMGDDNKIHRYKEALFTVNGQPHSIKISMPDFDAGKTYDIVKAEAEKIIAAYGPSKK